MLYRPSAPVISPVAVPSISTAAPASGWLSSALVTVPLITAVCAKAADERNARISGRIILFIVK